MARQKNPDTERPRYFYEFADKDGVLRTVEAHTADQAVRFVYRIKVRRLTSADAVRLYKTGAEVLDATKAADDIQPELPLQDGTSGAQSDDGEKTTASAGPDPIANETPAQAVSEPDPSPAPKRALFGRKTA